MNSMPDGSKRVLVFETAEALYAEAAKGILESANSAIDSRSRFLFVLAGGETPKPLYKKLAQEPPYAAFPWQNTLLFWGDERAVPPDDPQSNYGMAFSHLLHAIPIPEQNILRIKGELGAAAAAQNYARELQQMADPGLAWPRFDLVLLGLGSDGHTASLFPGSTHPARSGQATLAVTGSYDQRPTSRVTMTPPVFNSAHQIFYLVAGERKAPVVASVLEGKRSAVRLPARRIKPTSGTITWFLDRAAASDLSESTLTDRI